MKKTNRKRPTAEAIARMADKGENVTQFFSGKGRMMKPLRRVDIQRVNVDFTPDMLNELDTEARRLNISRQAVIKTMVSRALEQREPRRKRAS